MYTDYGFRPLSGNYISQRYVGNFIINQENSFRPLSGNYISQQKRGVLLCNFTDRFRPLSGNYISQRHPYNPATSLGS